ncbi:MAG: DUF2336 domain-containing protein [Hyphomicrobiales bacterium]
MFKQTVEAMDNPAAAGFPSRHRGESKGTPAPNRRITADSFRMLTARLSKMPEPPAAAAVSNIVPEYPPAPAPEPVPHEAAFYTPPPPEPVFEEPPPPGIFAPPPVTDVTPLPLPPLPDFELPAFQPLGPVSATEILQIDLSESVAIDEVEVLDPAQEWSVPAEQEMPAAPLAEDLQAFTSMPEQPPAQPEPEAFVPAFSDEEPVFGIFPEPPPPAQAEADGPPPESSLAALLQQPMVSPEAAAVPEQSVHIRPAEVAFAAAAPVEPQPAAFADPFKVTQPFAERIVDTILKNVADAVFAKPSDSDRATYLAEVAAMLEELRAAADVENAKMPEPAPAPETPQPAWPLPRASFGSARPAEPSAEELALPVELPREPPRDPSAEARPASLREIVAAKSRRSRPPKKEPSPPDIFADAAEPETALAAKQALATETDEDAGELARSLLDMMSSGGSVLPQERALAADTLLRLTPRIPTKTLVAVVERLAVMDNPPQLLLAKLIRDPCAEVAAALLERCMHITDHDLMNAISDGDPVKLRMIARRRSLSPALTDKLIAHGDPSVLLTLARNPGALLSHDAYYRLAEYAEHHHGLLAPLATRADLPAPVAFELFWLVPAELRRFIFSRFLTDSENLNKILKITLAMQNDASTLPEESEVQFPDKELVEMAIDLAVEGKLEEAAERLAEIGGICKKNAERILSDADGEPLAVLFKALGYPRGRLAMTLGRLKQPDCGLLREDRNTEDLQNIFDTLSFNKARILLTYWDWYAQKSGPYAPR